MSAGLESAPRSLPSGPAWILPGDAPTGHNARKGAPHDPSHSHAPSQPCSPSRRSPPLFPRLAETPVKFSLDWKFEGPAAPFLLAKEKGYFADEGLDVTIDTGAGSVEPINRVASGAYDMGFGDINSVIKFNDQNPTTPLKSVYMIYNKPAFAIVGRKSLGVIGAEGPRGQEARRAGPRRRLCPVADLRRGERHRRVAR